MRTPWTSLRNSLLPALQNSGKGSTHTVPLANLSRSRSCRRYSARSGCVVGTIVLEASIVSPPRLMPPIERLDLDPSTLCWVGLKRGTGACKDVKYVVEGQFCFQPEDLRNRRRMSGSKIQAAAT